VGASADPSVVRLAGLASLVAGACSMAVGEYISMRAQVELLERLLTEEREAIARNPDRQAAILRARLTHLRSWTDERRTLATRYRALLAGAVGVSAVPEQDSGHVYHLFVVRSADRDALRAHLGESGVETLIHYPVAIPRQPALAETRPDGCPVAARTCGEILSLPLHPALRDDEVDEIAAAVHAFKPRTVVS